MMAFVELLRDRFRDVTGWKEACEAGPPVPHSGGCTGVNCPSIRLTNLRPGQHGAISCLEEPWTGDAARLASLGILPGVRVRLVQRYPAFVLQLGRAEIAMDDALAARVRVRLD